MCFVVLGQAQKDVVKWNAEIVHESGDSYSVVLTADIDDKWCIYSQHLGDEGPIPTEFTFNESDLYIIDGKTVESDENREETMDDMFGMKLTKYKKKAIFTQSISAKGNLDKVEGTVTYMTCDDKRCLPPTTIDFTAYKRQ